MSDGYDYNRVEAKFVVGSTLVTVAWDPTETLVATDGNDTWTPTLQQIEEHYTPVCEHAERFSDLVEGRPGVTTRD